MENYTGAYTNASPNLDPEGQDSAVPHWMVSAVLLPAHLLLIILGAHLTTQPLVKTTRHLKSLRAHLAEVNLLLAGLLVFLLVLPLHLLSHICALLRVDLTYQCTLFRFFLRLAEGHMFVSLPWIAIDRLKRLWNFMGRRPRTTCSLVFMVLCWLLLLPLSAYLSYLATQDQYKDNEYQLCVQQAKILYLNGQLPQMLIEWTFVAGVTVTFITSNVIYILIIRHLRHRLFKIGPMPESSDPSAPSGEFRTSSVSPKFATRHRSNPDTQSLNIFPMNFLTQRFMSQPELPNLTGGDSPEFVPSRSNSDLNLASNSIKWQRYNQKSSVLYTRQKDPIIFPRESFESNQSVLSAPSILEGRHSSPGEGKNEVQAERGQYSSTSSINTSERQQSSPQSLTVPFKLPSTPKPSLQPRPSNTAPPAIPEPDPEAITHAKTPMHIPRHQSIITFSSLPCQADYVEMENPCFEMGCSSLASPSERWRNRMRSCPPSTLGKSVSSFCHRYYDGQHGMQWMNLPRRKQLPPLTSSKNKRKYQVPEEKAQEEDKPEEAASNEDNASQQPLPTQEEEEEGRSQEGGAGKIPRVKIIRPSTELQLHQRIPTQKPNNLNIIRENSYDSSSDFRLSTGSRQDTTFDLLSVTSRAGQGGGVGRVDFLSKAMRRTAILQGVFIACLILPFLVDVCSKHIPFQMLINIHPVAKLLEYLWFLLNPILYVRNYKPMAKLLKTKPEASQPKISPASSHPAS